MGLPTAASFLSPRLGRKELLVLLLPRRRWGLLLMAAVAADPRLLPACHTGKQFERQGGGRSGR